MSWQDCGFRPVAPERDQKCPRGMCDVCDGFHHFLPDFPPTGEPRFVCKHCSMAAAVEEDDDDEDYG